MHTHHGVIYTHIVDNLLVIVIIHNIIKAAVIAAVVIFTPLYFIRIYGKADAESVRTTMTKASSWFTDYALSVVITATQR